MVLLLNQCKIVSTVLCCVVYDSCAQRHTHTCEQFLKLTVGLGGCSVFLCFFPFQLVLFCSGSMFPFVVLGLVSSELTEGLAGKNVSEVTCFVSSGT